MSSAKRAGKRSGTRQELNVAKLVSEVRFSGDSDPRDLLESSKHVYARLDDYGLFRPVSEGSDGSLPCLEILIYAVRDLVFPTFLGPDRIADLLDLLTSIENYRLVCMQKAEDATVFDEFYSMRNPAVVLLTKEERDTLNRMKAEGSSLRSYFLSLVLSYCQLDFHHLCTSPSMFAAAHRMEEYFKGQIPSTLAQTLSKEEQQQFRDMMDCCLRESLKLVEAYHHKRSKKRSSIDQQEAEEAYPCPVDLEHLVASTETYVRDIEQQVSALKVIFPS